MDLVKSFFIFLVVQALQIQYKSAFNYFKTSLMVLKISKLQISTKFIDLIKRVQGMHHIYNGTNQIVNCALVLQKQK